MKPVPSVAVLRKRRYEPSLTPLTMHIAQYVVTQVGIWSEAQWEMVRNFIQKCGLKAKFLTT